MAVGTTAAGGDFCEKWLNVVGKYVWIGKIAKIAKILLKNCILVGLGKSFSRSGTILKSPGKIRNVRGKFSFGVYPRKKPSESKILTTWRGGRFLEILFSPQYV